KHEARTLIRAQAPSAVPFRDLTVSRDISYRVSWFGAPAGLAFHGRLLRARPAPCAAFGRALRNFASTAPQPVHIIPVGFGLRRDLNLDDESLGPEPSGQCISRGLAGITRIVVAKDDDALNLEWRLPCSQHPGIHGGPAGYVEERRSRESRFDALRNPKRISSRRKPERRTFRYGAGHHASRCVDRRFALIDRELGPVQG